MPTTVTGAQQPQRMVSLLDRLTECFMVANPTKIGELPGIIQKMRQSKVSQVQLFAKLAFKYQAQKDTPIARCLHVTVVEDELRDWLLHALRRSPDLQLRVQKNRDDEVGLLHVLRDGSILCHLCHLDYRDTTYVSPSTHHDPTPKGAAGDREGDATTLEGNSSSGGSFGTPTDLPSTTTGGAPSSRSFFSRFGIGSPSNNIDAQTATSSITSTPPRGATSTASTRSMSDSQSSLMRLVHTMTSSSNGGSKNNKPEANTKEAEMHQGRSDFYARENLERFLTYCAEVLGWGPGFFTSEGLMSYDDEELILHRLLWLSLRLWETGVCDTRPPLCAIYDVSCWKGVEGRTLKDMFPVPSKTKGMAKHIGELLEALGLSLRVDFRDNYLQIWHPIEHPAPIELPCVILQDYLCVKAGMHWQLAGAVVSSYLLLWCKHTWQIPCYPASQHANQAPIEETVTEVKNNSFSNRRPPDMGGGTPMRGKASPMPSAGGGGSPGFPGPHDTSTPSSSGAGTIQLVPNNQIWQQSLGANPEFTPCSSVGDKVRDDTASSSVGMNNAVSTLTDGWTGFFSDLGQREQFDVTFIHKSEVTDSLCKRLTTRQNSAATVGGDTTESTPLSPGSTAAGPPLTVRVVPEANHSLLGRGSFGTVFLGLDLSTGRSVALKIIPVGVGSNKYSVESEVALICRVEHPCIVKCYGVSLTETNCLCIAMEYAAAGTLLELLRRFSPIPLQLAYRYICGIAEGLDYLHSERIIHCDLKPQNILVRGDGSVAISDFGCSQSVASVAIVQSQAGTLAYMSPECVQSRSFSKESDVWAFGCCVAELCTGQAPWMNYTEWEQVMYRLGATTEAPFTKEQLTSIGDAGLVEIIESCLSRNPKERPGMADVLCMVRSELL